MRNQLARYFKNHYRLLVAVLLLVALALTGGASLYNENQQPLARLAAIAAILATLWPLELDVLNANKRILFFIGAIYLLVLVQLVPLPAELWASLPGREVFAAIARASDTVSPRPLSLTPDLTLNALFALLPATAAMLASLYLSTRGRYRLLLAILVVGGTSAALGLIQAGTGGSAFHLYRHSSDLAPVGLFANRNHQAVLLACALPITGAVAGIRTREGGDFRKILAVALGAALLLLLALVSTGSRMGVVLGSIGTLAGIACYLAARPLGARLRLRGALTVAGLGLLSLGVIGLTAARSGALERLALTDTVTETRAAMIAPLLTTARAFFPIGSGFGSFDSVYRRFEPDSLLSTIYMNQAHNEVLQLAIEGGLLALALLALFLCWWASTVTRVLQQRVSARVRATGLAATAVTVILMASSLVDYPLRTPLLGALFAIACVEMTRSASLRPAPNAEAPAASFRVLPATARRRWQPQ